MAELVTAYIGLGSNLGDREALIKNAAKILAETSGIELTRISDITETAPLGQMEQPDYLNAVAELKTSLPPEGLLKVAKEIESSLGRKKSEKWSSRVIDVDILLYGQQVINNPDLTIPHPQMHLRSFVLEGLCQLNPQLIHPTIKESIEKLKDRLNSADFVINPNLPQLISIAGIIGVGKTTLAKKLSKALSAKLLLEPYDANPFMPQVYAGKKDMALDSQLYFLTHRAKQLAPVALKQGQIAVSDYIFDKEPIYAKNLLDSQQLALYEQIHPSFAPEIVAPVLVIYLTDSLQKCLANIHQRNRPYEQKIEQKFLEALSNDYEQLFGEWKSSPIIRISMSDFDCIQKADIENLVNQTRSYIAV